MTPKLALSVARKAYNQNVRDKNRLKDVTVAKNSDGSCNHSATTKSTSVAITEIDSDQLSANVEEKEN